MMALTINTNLSSLMVQLSLKKSTLDLNRALEQMTTGYRINSAKDDAAGYAVATKMDIDLSSYRVAQNNANLGLSLINTAESSLDIVTTHLQRIRDLAEQSANGTYDLASRQAIQMEVDERTIEIEHLITSAEFNGRKLFESESGMYVTGDFVSDVTQISEEDAIAQGYTIIKTADDLDNIRNNLSGKYILMNDIDLSGIDWEPIGKSGNAFTGVLEGNGFVIRNLHINSTSNYVGLFGYSNGGAINNIGLENVNLIGNNYVGGLVGFIYQGTKISNCYVTGNITGNLNVGGITGFTQFGGTIDYVYVNANIKGVKTVGGIAGDLKSTVTNSFALGRISGDSGVGGIGGSFQNSKIVNSYSNMYIMGNSSVGAVAGVVPDWNVGTITDTYYNTDKTGTLTAIGNNPAGIYGGDGINTSELNNLISQSILPISKHPVIAPGSIITNLQVGIDSSQNSIISIDTGLSLSINFDLTTSESSRFAINTIDTALDKIVCKQTELGAVQNRLESVIDSLDVSIKNTTSSLSTIKDVDIAKVSSEFIRAQILQQASAALLATANQSPSIALGLI